ncbi:MAG: hypothetical protein P1U86_10825 [Verrucomicrobiales bacterium]|nr:hypothetical protein [Verrucomicrobiales bacterium]
MQAIAKTPYLKRLSRNSLEGVRSNLIPGFFLWLVGLTVVAVYYLVPPARGSFEWVSGKKEQYGYLYSGVSTALFGGLIPFLYLWWRGGIPRGRVVSWGLFLVIYWSIKGIEVDALYRFQGWLFGEGTDFKTIVAKVCVDQFVYCPFWSAPLTAIFYGWKVAGFSWKRLRPKLNRDFFLMVIPGVLLSTWIVWLPAVAIIYALPPGLQIPLFNLVLCFFVLLISMLSKDESRFQGEA